MCAEAGKDLNLLANFNLSCCSLHLHPIASADFRHRTGAWMERSHYRWQQQGIVQSLAACSNDFSSGLTQATYGLKAASQSALIEDSFPTQNLLTPMPCRCAVD
jgi:hypothetical protein